MKFSIKNKAYFFSFWLFVLAITITQAQNIKVLNKITKEPVIGAAIFNTDKTKSVVSDINGNVSLDIFDEDETLSIKHITFQLKNIVKSKLNKNVIYLDPDTQGLKEVVVSAYKFKQNKRDIPKTITSINAKTIAFNNPQTSADLLESTGQIYVQKSQLGGGSPMIRGFSTNRLLITVDGVRMNNAIFRGGNLQNVISIDPFSIKNTEVILGPSSVIYGSDAIGGVMSFFTEKPQLSYSDSTYIKANSVLRYATASKEKTGHLGFNFGLKKWAFLTNLSYTSFNDLRMGKHGPIDYLRPEFVITNNNEDTIVENNNPLVQRFSGYDQINLMQKVRFEPENNLSLDLGVYYTATSDNPRYDRLIRYRGDQLRSAEWYYGPQKWFMTNLNATKLSSNSNLYDKIKATAAYQNFKESRVDRNFQSTNRRVREESVNALSFNLDLEKTLSPKIKVFYGLEYVYNKIASQAKTEDITTNETTDAVTRYPNGSTWQSAAIYANIKYKPNPKFVFQSGLRFNNVDSRADFSENNRFLDLPFSASKNTSGALTGTAGVSWLPSKTLQWRLNFSSAFRAPNIDDIGKVFDSEPGSVVVPNESLKHEYAYGGELGLTLNFDDIIVFDTATYYTYLNNALVRKNGNLNGETSILYDGEISNVQSIQNASKSWIYGFEAGIKVNFSKNLKLTSQYNIIGGTEDNDGVEVPVRHVAPNFGNTHFVWHNNKFKTDAFINYNNALSFNQLAPSEREKDYIYALDEDGNPYSPSWYTLNLRTQYQLNGSVSLTASIENITDQRYRTYSSGISAPGRNLIVSLKYGI